ncbi:MAG: DUF2079 domain-containing protein [Proteobacteria bacterium]|nr:DUF2079 domain-containing protein [Pseudomonadota bacterium]
MIFVLLLLFQYSAPIIPFVVVSGIYGAWLILKRYSTQKTLFTGMALYILTSSILSNLYFCTPIFNLYIRDAEYYLGRPKVFFSIWPNDLKYYYQNWRKRRLFENLECIIPKDASISVQDNLLARFSHQKTYTFPEFKDADYIIQNSFAWDRWVVMWSTPDEYSKGNNNLSNDNRFQLFFVDKPSRPEIFLYGRKEEKERIIKRAQELISRNPSSSEAYFILGSIYYQTSYLAKAEQKLKTALSFDPDNTYAKQMLEEISNKKILDKD